MWTWAVRNVPIKLLISADVQMYSFRHLLFSELFSATAVMETADNMLSCHHQIQPVCATFASIMCYTYVLDMSQKSAYQKMRSLLVNLDSDLPLDIRGFNRGQKMAILTILFIFLRNVRSVI